MPAAFARSLTRRHSVAVAVTLLGQGQNGIADARSIAIQSETDRF